MNLKTQPVDRISFILGMITAFAECLANESKRMALSPPFYSSDYSSVLPEAERIAREQGIHLWYEENPDLPPANRLHWFVMYKFPEVLEEYKKLRNKGFNPIRHFSEFGALLSYGTAWGKGADGVLPMMREVRPTEDTVGRILLGEGVWPPIRDKE
ncbi:MAG: hypothetical protein JRH13_05310 [Deltaproteobacteria bacterium]|nr:hypothetical protein [Deltaproteobacteria bacterium]MBW2128763.1 hypothetical protein [Deltaproteobacteria bacterium]MBW2303909.1 hypothetical protein [Deltaproteobacteria bacterium]